MAFTSQAFTIVTLLESIQQALELVIAPVSSKHQVRLWVSDERPRFEGVSAAVTYRLTYQTPDQFAGAGRRGALSSTGLEIYTYTRYASDAAGTDWSLLTNQANGFYRVFYRTVDCFQDLNIFSAYNADWQPNELGVVGIPEGAVPLTTCPCQMTEFNVPYKSKPDPGWIVGRVKFDLRLVQPLTL
jgi:hypothetical protein